MKNFVSVVLASTIFIFTYMTYDIILHLNSDILCPYYLNFLSVTTLNLMIYYKILLIKPATDGSIIDCNTCFHT